MYAYIRGTVTELQPSHITVETTSGIGYEIQTPNSYRFQSQLNKQVTVYTSLIVREDAQLLYGFIDQEEKTMFLSLIKVTGIGPKSALAILAASTPVQVKRAIEHEDEAYLTQFPGIGKKTARQIILDLKGKVVIEASVDDGQLNLNMSNDEQISKDALLALDALGYSKRELQKVEKAMQKESFETVDEAVKFGLKQLIG
ncbi:Holliday junction branch migration protein RuvA [Staphylococcus rostri]|uniref:Holliday junction branch migration complex subunit RuvA n=1 Tax=Staphylococcus rostri TaxID=522262 RepID=A0A2K3YHU2_9STAP|nr:Holliday junction branch migration protein RuvA [Staphylococcus rostri]MDO5374590.1 Holliday junction branch migration protein RuvA [Staphylococcus rostri]PNZ25149.1 Holliday junction branch migration protein RuvA [Staphylococcus rostri]